MVEGATSGTEGASLMGGGDRGSEDHQRKRRRVKRGQRPREEGRRERHLRGGTEGAEGQRIRDEGKEEAQRCEGTMEEHGSRSHEWRVNKNRAVLSISSAS